MARVMRQVILENVAEDSEYRSVHRLTCWVEDDDRIKPGAILTLKNHDMPEEVWDVVHVGIPHDAGDIKRGWNNNI